MGLIHVAATGIGHGTTTQGKGREGKWKGRGGSAGSHSSSGRSRPSKAADRLTVASCPSMNEQRR